MNNLDREKLRRVVRLLHRISHQEELMMSESEALADEADEALTVLLTTLCTCGAGPVLPDYGKHDAGCVWYQPIQME
ncbi:MAG: hypothetical protein H0T73_05170 [Ardenticatenales bacterium]|nr:hypothetical protein [Ardenticatenales bacterium]